MDSAIRLWLKEGLISEEEFARLKAQPAQRTLRLAESAAGGDPERRFRLMAAVCRALELPVYDGAGVDSAVSALLPPAVALRHRCLPVRLEGNRLILAMEDPFDLFAAEDLHLRTGHEIAPCLATPALLETLGPGGGE